MFALFPPDSNIQKLLLCKGCSLQDVEPSAPRSSSGSAAPGDFAWKSKQLFTRKNTIRQSAGMALGSEP